jgi:hypothetical protein
MAVIAARRQCAGITRAGRACAHTPLRDGAYCLWHDPDLAEEAQQARRLGGQRRKRERVIHGAYEFQGLATVEDMRRVLEVAVVDTLGLDNGVQRNRTLGSLVMVAAKLLEVGELQDRLERIEATLGEREKPLRAVAS